VSAPSLNLCAEPDCWRDQWASRKGRRWVRHSVYCEEHAQLLLVDLSRIPVTKPPGRINSAVEFRKAVERRRIAETQVREPEAELLEDLKEHEHERAEQEQ
jgi:hypothetical protein